MSIKISKATVNSFMLASVLLYLLSPIGTNSVPAPGGTGGIPSTSGGPRWAMGDILHSHGYAGVSWRVMAINYAPDSSYTYSVEFTEPGKVSNFMVSRSSLESSDIYKVN